MMYWKLRLEESFRSRLKSGSTHCTIYLCKRWEVFAHFTEQGVWKVSVWRAWASVSKMQTRDSERLMLGSVTLVHLETRWNFYSSHFSSKQRLKYYSLGYERIVREPSSPKVSSSLRKCVFDDRRLSQMELSRDHRRLAINIETACTDKKKRAIVYSKCRLVLPEAEELTKCGIRDRFWYSIPRLHPAVRFIATVVWEFTHAATSLYT